MKYDNYVEALFIRRINRFIALVDIEGRVTEVHVKNTGRCQELFIEGVVCYLEESHNPSRKTKYSLISLYKGDKLINLDSQVPNQVVQEAILAHQINLFGAVDKLKREVTYGDSRFDLYYEQGTEKGFIEVKGVTLEIDGVAMFPDAPTVRGRKHIEGLIKGQKNGYHNAIFFLVQMDGITNFKPHYLRDKAFAEALYHAHQAGVRLLAYNAKVTPEGICLNEPVTIILDDYKGVNDGNRDK